MRVDSSSSGLDNVYSFGSRINGQYFATTYFAVAADGDSGFAVHQQLRVVAYNKTSLLWEGPK